MAINDFIVVGGGIAGASAGFALASRGCRVVVLERESQPGYHSTGRSAALYSETYGPAVVRALTSGGKQFFLNPPDGFSDHPILTPRGAMYIGRPDQTGSLERIAREGGKAVATVRLIDAGGARKLVPVLREDYLGGAVIEPEAMDIDVHGLHHGFLQAMRRRGGMLVTNAELLALEFKQGVWLAQTPAGRFSAPAIVNATGAWCDKIAALAGARRVNLTPKRRTVAVFEPPANLEIDRWPAVLDVDEQFYFKPDSGKILASPADETPMEPCDARPDELDIAIAIDRVQRAAELPVHHISNRWAGLRSFVMDKCPVVGFDPEIRGFFWLAGQGGYGIQTSPSMGLLCAGIATGDKVPPNLAVLGVTAEAVSPARFS